MKEKMKLIGKKAIISTGGLKVNVKVLDYKQTYGHERWLVSPVSGDGKVWVEKILIK